MKYVLALAGALLLPATTAAEAQQTLVFAAATSERSPMSTDIFTNWVARINADGAGIVQIDFRPGMALASPANFYDRVSDGIVDITWCILTQVPGQFPRLSVLELPFLTQDTSTAVIEPFSMALWDLYTSGLVDSEFDEVVPLFMTTYAQSPVHLSQGLDALDDLGGRRIIAGGATLSASLTAVGGVPLSINAGDSYEAVQRGTADGRLMSWTAIPAFRFGEVTTQHVEVPLGTAPGGVIINRAVWEGLTPEARAIIERHSGEAMVRIMAEFQIAQTEEIRQEMLDLGHTIVRPTPEQLADWHERTEPARAAWLAETPDGAAVLEHFTGSVAHYSGAN